MRSFSKLGVLLFLTLVFGLGVSHEAHAATCTISSDTVVDQAYVDSGSCSAINISANVSTTWIGTVDLQAPGGGAGTGIVTVQTGSTMTMGISSVMVLGADDDFVVETGAATTHIAEDPAGVQITARNITVQASGAIDASQKGCHGGTLSNGYGPNSISGICEAGAPSAGIVMDSQHGSGGSYGGMGGGVGPERVVGDSLNPILLGSGGGGETLFGIPAGAGGGRIQLTASGTLTIDGVISSNGSSGGGIGYYSSGSGSGGSISMSAATLTGSGSVSANGGAGSPGGYSLGSAGGGGRIKVVYDTLGTFDLAQVRADKIGTSSGDINVGPSNGTTYILDRVTDDGAGTLTISSGFDFPDGGDYTRNTISVGSDAYLSCGTSTSLMISSTNWISLSGVTWNCRLPVDAFTLSSAAGLSTTSTNLSFSAATSVTMNAPTWTNVTTTMSVTQSGSSATFNIAGDLTLDDFTYTSSDAGALSALGGYLVLPNHTAFSMVSSTIMSSVTSTLLTSVSIDGRSLINASGKGCAGNRVSHGYGPDDTTGICTLHGPGSGTYAVAGGGAGHGGVGGGGGAGGAVYDSEIFPLKYGASGAAGLTEYVGVMLGGSGGGVVFLNMDGALTVDGAIMANGLPGGETSRNGVGGGGAGGSVYASSTSFAGRGYIEANGGDRLPAMYGGASYAGGGGRVFVMYRTLVDFDMSAVHANAGSQPTAYDGFPGAGTVNIPDVAPDLPTFFGPTSLVTGMTTSTNNPSLNFTLTDPDVADTLRYRIQIDDTADFSSPLIDYTSALDAQGPRTFQVGQAAGIGGSYSIGSPGQTLLDSSYYWRVRTIDAASAVSSNVTANAGAVAFIVDTTARTVGFHATTASGSESVTSVDFQVDISTAHFEDVTIPYTVTGGTATGGGVDYTLAAGSVTILAGGTSTSIHMTVVDDALDENDETVEVTLGAPTAGANTSLGASTVHTYTMTDNDAPPTITLSRGAASIAEAAGSTTLTATLSALSALPVTVNLSYSGTATANGVDYTTSTNSIVIPAGELASSTSITAVQDSIDEPGETIVVDIDSVTNGTEATPQQQTVTINDDDTSSVTVSTSTLSLSEGGSSASYTYVLTSEPTSTVQLLFTTSTNGVTLSTNILPFTNLNWNVPQSLTVFATDDLVYESTHTTSVQPLVSSTNFGYTSSLVVDPVVVTITDNETSDITLSQSTLSITEGSSASYTIVLASAPTSTVSILLTSGSDITLSTSTLTFTPSTYNTPQTVTVTATDDAVYTGNRTSSVTQTVSSTSDFVSVLLPAISVTILENDAQGGGGGLPGGMGGTIGSVALIWSSIPAISPPSASLPVREAPVVSTPASPVPIVSILNPTDVLSLVEATNGSRDFTREAQNQTLLRKDAREFHTPMTDADSLTLANFVTYGISERTRSLGAGERRALVRDALQTMGTSHLNAADLERMARGIIPEFRNISRERQQLPRVRSTFHAIYGHDPNFQNSQENLAWNTLMYRMRFPRDLAAERQGILSFRSMFHRDPVDPFQWATVRVMGYVRG